MYVRQKSRGDKVIRHCLALGIDIKTKEHNSHHVIKPYRQIAKWLRVTILARIQWLLASTSLLDSRFQMVFVVCHFGVGCWPP